LLSTPLGTHASWPGQSFPGDGPVQVNSSSSHTTMVVNG
jgi:hypothetical protein